MKVRALLVTIILCLSAVTVVVAVRADAPEAMPSATDTEAVAREIVEIQKRLGGSIVRLSAADDATRQEPTSNPMESVTALRDVAWRLDRAAHRLENLDLYAQADACRELAGQLRRDARRLKREVGLSALPASAAPAVD